MHFSLKLIGEGKTYKEVQKIIGCSAKMISNALKWRAKPETRGRKRKTTIKMDRRITRMAKAQPMISSRMIKDSLELPVSTVTVRRRLSAGLDCVCDCVTPPWLTVPASAIHGRAVMWHQLSLKRTPCSHFSIPLSSPLPASLPPEVRAEERGVEALLDMSRGTHPRFF
uniref:Transposase Tc1-like domain-containing protein n=1 Tax=Mola mola TaxID=94237 RepID=A0A3Q4AY50_MOLML